MTLTETDAIRVRRPNRHSLVEVRAVGGADAGRIWSLGMGTHTLGPAPDSAIVLPGAPSPGIRLTVTARGESWVSIPATPTEFATPALHTIRPRSAAGTAWAPFDDPSAAREFRWPEGSELAIGGTRLGLLPVHPAANRPEQPSELARVERDLLLERVVRCAEVPDPASLASDVVGRKAAVWRRGPGRQGRLWLRVGSADGLSEAKVTLGDRPAERWILPSLPCGVNLTETGVLGVCGAPDVARALARWLVIQAATHCGPAALGIRMVADPSVGRSWDWLGQLPHVDGERGGEPSKPYVAADPLRVGRSIAELVTELGSRRDVREDRDILVVFDRASMLREVDGVAEILDQGPEFGIYALCVDAADAVVPECRAEVRCSAGSMSLTARRHTEKDRSGITPDQVGVEWCEQVAGAVAAHGPTG